MSSPDAEEAALAWTYPAESDSGNTEGNRGSAPGRLEGENPVAEVQLHPDGTAETSGSPIDSETYDETIAALQAAAPTQNRYPARPLENAQLEPSPQLVPSPEQTLSATDDTDTTLSSGWILHED